jgi:hypothetical protein
MNCKNCNKEFERTHFNMPDYLKQIYCSEKCKKLYWLKTLQDHNLKCVNCGKKIFKQKYNCNKYCSRKCYYDRSYAKRKNLIKS